MRLRRRWTTTIRPPAHRGGSLLHKNLVLLIPGGASYFLVGVQSWVLQASMPKTTMTSTTSMRRTSRTEDLSRSPLLLRVPVSALAATSPTTFQIDYNSEYGRGEDHLSAILEEGDVVVYQKGTWFVDGVAVGDGSSNNNHDSDSDDDDGPTFQWARLDTMQVVWTHNCEHGVLRGIALREEPIRDNNSVKDPSTEISGTACIRRVSEIDPLEFVEFGPEQLVARVPVEWNESMESCEGVTMVPVADWK